MRPESRKYLWDASQAVDRQFEIIGESLAQLRTVDAETAASVPESARIVAFRNLLIHGYATVDDKIVWGASSAAWNQNATPAGEA